ncbi:MAG: hypothetical protein IJ936_06175, partial [Peptococcaceae bacterium]|nr:hypothetical protein [Peptococcaceae bacterium]
TVSGGGEQFYFATLQNGDMALWHEIDWLEPAQNLIHNNGLRLQKYQVANSDSDSASCLVVPHHLVNSFMNICQQEGHTLTPSTGYNLADINSIHNAPKIGSVW